MACSNCVKENVELYYEENGKGYGYTFEFITDKSLQEIRVSRS